MAEKNDPAVAFHLVLTGPKSIKHPGQILHPANPIVFDDVQCYVAFSGVINVNGGLKLPVRAGLVGLTVRFKIGILRAVNLGFDTSLQRRFQPRVLGKCRLAICHQPGRVM